MAGTMAKYGVWLERALTIMVNYDQLWLTVVRSLVHRCVILVRLILLHCGCITKANMGDVTMVKYVSL